MGGCIRLLIVEDSEDDALLLVRELRRGGFESEFERVETAESMSNALAKRTWDLVLADYVMPQFSGIAALQLLKQTGVDIPFIVVSGNIGEEVAVAAMKAGAHDYIMKGNLQRLVPSVQRELREAEMRREHRKVEIKARRNAERIQALHEIDLAITSTLDLKAVLDILLEKIDCVRPSLVTTVRLFNKETGALEPVACRNVNETEWKAITGTGVKGLAQIVVENKIPLMVANIQTDPRNPASQFAQKEGLISYLGVPLIAKRELLGVIAFYTRERYSFSDDESEFLITLAGQAAIAIHNATLHEQVKKQMLELEKSNKVKDEFLSVISHELRTPLNVTMGYTALLKEGALGPINPEQAAALEKVTTHTKDLLKMIDGILCVRSLEANAVEVWIEEVNVRNLLDELQADYAMSLGRDVQLLCEYPAGLPMLTTCLRPQMRTVSPALRLRTSAQASPPLGSRSCSASSCSPQRRSGSSSPSRSTRRRTSASWLRGTCRRSSRLWARSSTTRCAGF